jgi:hypothetical protein
MTLLHAQTTVEPVAFRYEEVQTTSGETKVRRVRYTLSEKKEMDQQRIDEILQNIGEYLPAGQENYVDPQAVAEWQNYWEQLKLWDDYVSERLLAGRTLEMSVYDVDFNNPEAIPDHIQAVYDSHRVQAQEVVEEYYTNFVSLLGRIEERVWQREVYRGWVERNKVKLQEFAGEWLRRHTGEEIEIEGKVYLVSPKPLKQVPEGKVNIVTTNLTPYDIINNDGSLKTAPGSGSME